MSFALLFLGIIAVTHGLDCYGSGELILNFGQQHVVNSHNPGKIFTTQAVSQQPIVNFEPITDGNYYSVMMCDPDAPNPANATLADILHWMILNADGYPITNGQVLEPYLSPAPPQGSPYHHYCVFLFESLSPINFTAPPQRTNFNCTNFEGVVESFQGRILGSTYFLSEYSG